MAHSIYVLDKTGTPTNAVSMDIGNGVIVGQPVSGALAGWKGLSYSPVGAMIDGVPQNSVQVPLSDWRNVAVGAGAQLVVWDDNLAAEVTRGPVIDVQDSVDVDDVHWASVTFADVLYDLVRADVSSSFATSQNETLSLTGTRLVGLADTPWTFANDVAGLDGIAFTATGSVVQAFDKLRQERFAHFRREMVGTNPRLLHFANYGTPWLVDGTPVWLVAPPPNPTAGATNPYRREMFAPRFARKIEVVNAITPTGAGNGAIQLTLRTLYGNTSFAGYDPTHPILQRPCQSGATSDGFNYYIEDAASIALYGRTRGACAQPSIGPVVNSAGGVSTVDQASAAIALYTVALNVLKRSSVPTIEITFTTPAVGDVRNAGGLTVHVTYDGWAFDEQKRALQFLNIDADYWVTNIVRAEADDGTAMDTWTVSSSGHALASASGVLLGVMDTVTQMHTAVQPYPYPVTKQKAQPIGPNAPLRLYLYADNSVSQQHWLFLYVTLEGVRHTRSDTGHTSDVVTAPTPHDVFSLPHDTTALAHDTAAKSVGVTAPATTSASGGNYSQDPGAHLNIFGSPTGVPVMWDGNFLRASTAAGGGTSVGGVSSNEIAVPNHTHGIPALNVTAALPATTGGTGGATVATNPTSHPNGAGALRATTGGRAGKTVTATHAASAGYGAVKTFATAESVYEGPLPNGVTVWVDNRQIAGQYNNVGALPPIDLQPYTNDQAYHQIEVRATTNGNADASLEGRRDVTTFATKPTG